MFKNKYISIILLWSLGLLMVIYLSIPFINNAKAGEEDPEAINNIHEVYFGDEGSSKASQAYVFVTINKKHFLTRFASYVPAENETPVIIPVSTNGRTVERVITRIKPAKGNKKQEDFSIKTAPLE